MIDLNYEIVWLGWNYQGNSDKIWGYFRLVDGRYYAFWGRRGKALQFKNHSREYDLSKLVSSKIKKGYEYINANDYNTLVKDFIDELELNCMTAILSDKVR